MWTVKCVYLTFNPTGQEGHLTVWCHTWWTKRSSVHKRKHGETKMNEVETVKPRQSHTSLSSLRMASVNLKPAGIVPTTSEAVVCWHHGYQKCSPSDITWETRGDLISFSDYVEVFHIEFFLNIASHNNKNMTMWQVIFLLFREKRVKMHEKQVWNLEHCHP